MLCLENLGNLLLDRAPGRLPSEHLVRPLGLATRVQTPADSLETGLVDRGILAQSLLLWVLEVAELDGLCAHLPGNIAPHVLAALCQDVTFSAPKLGVSVACHRGFDQEYVGVREIRNVDVVPAGLARTDDGNILLGQDELGQFVYLAATAGDGATSVALTDVLAIHSSRVEGQHGYRK